MEIGAFFQCLLSLVCMDFSDIGSAGLGILDIGYSSVKTRRYIYYLIIFGSGSFKFGLVRIIKLEARKYS